MQILQLSNSSSQNAMHKSSSDSNLLNNAFASKAAAVEQVGRMQPSKASSSHILGALEQNHATNNLNAAPSGLTPTMSKLRKQWLDLALGKINDLVVGYAFMVFYLFIEYLIGA
jgi:hypothetical protein